MDLYFVSPAQLSCLKQIFDIRIIFFFYVKRQFWIQRPQNDKIEFNECCITIWITFLNLSFLPIFCQFFFNFDETLPLVPYQGLYNVADRSLKMGLLIVEYLYPWEKKFLIDFISLAKL